MAYRRAGAIALASALLIAPGASAQQYAQSQPYQQHADDVRGTVATVDVQQSFIAFTDGRAYHVRKETVLFSDGREITITTVKPGAVIVVRRGVLASAASGAHARVIRAPQPADMVVQAPASSATVQVPQQTVTVQPQAPEIAVKSEAPEVVVESMPAPRMTVQGGSSALPALPSSAMTGENVNTIVVPLPASRLRVDVPRSTVVVQPPAPEIVVNLRPVEVAVQPNPQPQLSTHVAGERQPDVSALPQAAVTGAASVTTQNGSMTVTPQSERMTVEIPRNRIVVKPSAPDVVVQNPAPQVTIAPVPAPKVIYEGREVAAGAAPTTLDRTAPGGHTLTVTPPAQRVVVDVPRTVVLIQPQAPEIVLNAQPPEVLVKETPEPKLVMAEEAKPVVAAAPPPAAAAVERRVATVVPVTGIVERTDPQHHVLVLRDMNAVKLEPGVSFTVDGRPITFDQIKPGMLVSIYADRDAWRRHHAESADSHMIIKPDGSAASILYERIYGPGEGTARIWELSHQTP
jgi:hypothetical protein